MSGDLVFKYNVDFPYYMDPSAYDINMKFVDAYDHSNIFFETNSTDPNSILNSRDTYTLRLDTNRFTTRALDLKLLVVHEYNDFEGRDLQLGRTVIKRTFRHIDPNENPVKNAAFTLSMRPDIDLPKIFAKIAVRL